MSKKKRGTTARELMDRLQADPEWVAKRTAQDEAFAQREAELRAAEGPLREELEQAGVKVDSVWDLVNTSEPYEVAVPILLRHLGMPYPDAIREGIARALAVPAANPMWPQLRQHYEREPEGRAKDGLAVALGGASSPENLSGLLEILRDRRQGPSRVLLLGALARFAGSDTDRYLMELGSDPDLEKEIQTLFRKRNRGERPH